MSSGRPLFTKPLQGGRCVVSGLDDGKAYTSRPRVGWIQRVLGGMPEASVTHVSGPHSPPAYSCAEEPTRTLRPTVRVTSPEMSRLDRALLGGAVLVVLVVVTLMLLTLPWTASATSSTN